MAGTVGFVGLGRMGHHMARHLVGAGYSVIGLDVTPQAREAAAAVGVQVTADLSDLAATPVVMSSLPDSPQVREVYLGDGGLLGALGEGALCVDLSTIAVEATREIAAAARRAGVGFVDAPVSGTSIHAEAGTLAVMAGGDEDHVARATPFLEAFSASVRHMGPSGAGLEMKLITNRLLTAHLVAIGEALLDMEEAGLDVGGCIEVLRMGAIPRLLDYKAPAMVARDYSPLFTVGLMAKDLRLADMRRPARAVTAAAADVMAAAAASGLVDEDIAAVMRILEAGRA